MWYVLHDDLTGPNGRTYRQSYDVYGEYLEMYIGGKGWVASNVPNLASLQKYVALHGFELYEMDGV
jgi:hypothetical protein